MKGILSMANEKVYSIHMGEAICSVDLGDGSERGEYVNQDYILHKFQFNVLLLSTR